MSGPEPGQSGSEPAPPVTTAGEGAEGRELSLCPSPLLIWWKTRGHRDSLFEVPGQLIRTINENATFMIAET